MLLNDPPSYSKPSTFELKRAISYSSIQSPNNYENDEGSVFVENENVFESQPRILFEDERIEDQLPAGIEEIRDETNHVDDLARSLSKKQINCCSKRFGLIPLLATMAMFINILFLLIIALAIIVPSRIAEFVPIKELLISRYSVKSSFVYLRDMLELSALNNSLETINYSDFCDMLNYTLLDYNQSVFKMISLIPDSYEHSFMGNSNGEEVFLPLYQNWTEMIGLFCKLSNYTSNYTKLDEFYQQFNVYNVKYYNGTFKYEMELFETKFFEILEDIYLLCNRIDEFTIASGISVLVLSCLACVIVIPVGILVYLMLGRKLIRNEKKVRIESTNILKDTMADIGMRDEFKTFCKKAKVGIPFSILERIQYFKEFCKDSIDCQLKLYEITKEFVAEKSLAKGADIYIQQVSNELEKKLSHLERIKYEIIFEIHDSIQSESVYLGSMEWIIHQIDLYNNRQGSYETVDILHSKILDNLEKEISDILSLTHFQFKSTLALNMNTTSPNSPQSPTSDLPFI
ncbi:predicted protein [Naegleria gruberi]|uniref:Predicted protein n=1 Tax=Naegleria gruberi TaxID=5762 RepID=D2VFZ0_NAEGR|nr:uncharacterized protein NAEGRDRAFT_67794 [Naegleria gruberi]EFC44271.1 predicted protein [Naegleria gruberi]|eukprot:XP_002677015.1 predicted protein [Naegleria gruberi strain NEG-M]